MNGHGWVVFGEVGEYIDWRAWPVAIFEREDDARAFASECERLLKDATVRIRDADEWLDFAEVAKENGLAAMDPQASGYEDVRYTWLRVRKMER